MSSVSSSIGKDPFLPSGGVGLSAAVTSGVMVFLCCLAVALSGAIYKMSNRWAEELVETATIRLPAADQIVLDEQTAAIQTFLGFTPGIEDVAVLSRLQTEALMAEWVGDTIDLSKVELPRIIRLSLSDENFDAEILKSQLAAVTPQAYFDDHSKWRGALGQTVIVLRVVAFGMVALLVATLGVMIWLALRAAISANSQVISVMRQLGAEHKDISRGFVRRYVGLVGMGSVVGFLAGTVLLIFLPEPAEGDAFLSNITPSGLDWVVLIWVPIFALALAFAITRSVVRQVLDQEG